MKSAWANAAFGQNNVPIYMPRGRQAPYRSVLERIDSMGDGSSKSKRMVKTRYGI